MHLQGVPEELAGNGLRQVLVPRPAGLHDRAALYVLHYQHDFAAARIVCASMRLSVHVCPFWSCHTV